VAVVKFDGCALRLVTQLERLEHLAGCYVHGGTVVAASPSPRCGSDGSHSPSQVDIRFTCPCKRPSQRRDLSDRAITVCSSPLAQDTATVVLSRRTGHHLTRSLVRGGMAAQQVYVGALEASATRIVEYQPAMIPGLVQTSAYARELLMLPGGPGASGASHAEIEQLVDARIRRQQVLYERGKQIQIVIGEAALHDPPGTRSTLIEQLHRLIAVAGLSQVELAVVPLGTPMPIMPICNFSVHDMELVLVETLTGEQRLNDPSEVAVYAESFHRLLGAAAAGVDAVDLIQRVAAGLSAGCR
jgi:hypothetical protein